MTNSTFLNIAATLHETATQRPNQAAVIEPGGRSVSFRELDDLSDRLAHGMIGMGIEPGRRLVLMVRPGIEFIALTFALFKAGAVVVLIDPGMGPRRVFRCLDHVEPDGFVALSIVHALRVLSGRRFSSARWNVTVGRKWFWAGATYAGLLGNEAALSGRREHPGTDVPRSPVIVQTKRIDPAAIIFTSGSTGPAKGVVYEHGMFAAQVAALRDFYQIEPGGIDLPGLPLFALFNGAMGVTTVIPDMNPARPAQVDPRKFAGAIGRERVTQGFGSPAIWNRVGRYCESHNITFPALRRVFSAGAPVPVDVLARMKATLVAEGAEMYTPYGATEALPVTSITATEVISRTADQTRRGAGTCVGRPFPSIRMKIIAIVDGPIGSLAETRELPANEIGEIIVQGEVVTREYFRRPEATAAAKIADGQTFWHRMGDVGYLDDAGSLWFCGRKSQTVETPGGRMFTDRVEPIFNTHPRVARCALVGLGARPAQVPAIVVELESGTPSAALTAHLTTELRQIALAHENTRCIERFLYFRGSLPVDVRHNTKINREQLAEWAAAQ
ncbi:MAG TPA: fatty acid CoA ligase family protein [Planctomycetaceae bacterium]|jgi:acyl-CoA synthetase (AMP-forming)/AMP-acid ligase II